jgi:hypothetical protein
VPPAFAPRLQSCSEFWAPARLLPPGVEFPGKVLSLSVQSASWSAPHFLLVKVSGLISLPIFSVPRARVYLSGSLVVQFAVLRFGVGEAKSSFSL